MIKKISIDSLFVFIGRVEQCKNIENNKLFITINNIECKTHPHIHTLKR